MCDDTEIKDAKITLTTPTELLNVKCKCGNELSINGKQPGWVVNFHTGVDFNCPCGEVLSIKISE